MGNPDRGKHQSVQEVLDAAVDNSSLGELSATATAHEIDELLGVQDETGAEDFLWGFFTKLIQLASDLPPDDPRQAFLVDVLKILSTINRESVEVWGNSHALWADLPLFGPCMREAFNLSLKFDGTNKDNSAVSHWVSLNSFCAQVLGKGILDVSTYALWAMRSALEEENEKGSDDGAVLVSTLKRDTDISVAYHWLAHAGTKLWENVLAKTDLDEQAKRVLAPGNSYAAWSPNNGEPGFNRDRWKFWKHRLSDLGQQVERSAKSRAEKTIAMMNELDSKE